MCTCSSNSGPEWKAQRLGRHDVSLRFHISLPGKLPGKVWEEAPVT